MTKSCEWVCASRDEGIRTQKLVLDLLVSPSHVVARARASARGHKVDNKFV
jgi:hypothetical protein